MNSNPALQLKAENKKHILETDRLTLREIDENDTAFIIRLVNSPGWLQYIGDKQIHDTETALQYIRNGPQKSYVTNGFGLYLAETTSSHEPIGMCGIIKREGLENEDIGFALLPEYTGKGYALEMAKATLRFANIRLGIKKIAAITTQDNQKSISLLGKLGLHFVKTIRLRADEDLLLLFESCIAE